MLARARRPGIDSCLIAAAGVRADGSYNLRSISTMSTMMTMTTMVPIPMYMGLPLLASADGAGVFTTGTRGGTG